MKEGKMIMSMNKHETCLRCQGPILRNGPGEPWEHISNGSIYCPDDESGCHIATPLVEKDAAVDAQSSERINLPIPTNEESVAWAEEADRLASALWDLVDVIETDGLIPENVSYMRQAREVLKRWPVRHEMEAAKKRIWKRKEKPSCRNL